MRACNVGEANPNAKLQRWQVALIKRVYAERIMCRSEIAEEFGVAKGTIDNILKGSTWRNVKTI